MTTTDPCTCELGPDPCRACRPRQIHPLRMTDAEFDVWVASRKPEDHDETMRIVDARYSTEPVQITHEHKAILAAMDAGPLEDFPPEWIEPDSDPPRLTAQASRLFVEALAANA